MSRMYFHQKWNFTLFQVSQTRTNPCQRCWWQFLVTICCWQAVFIFFILHFSRCSWSCCLRRLRKKVAFLRVTWLWGGSSTTTATLGPIRIISSWCWAFDQSESRRIITWFIWFGVNGSEFEDFGQSHFRSSNWKSTTWPRLIILF